jgi:hypothetical protein
MATGDFKHGTEELSVIFKLFGSYQLLASAKIMRKQQARQNRANVTNPVQNAAHATESPVAFTEPRQKRSTQCIQALPPVLGGCRQNVNFVRVLGHVQRGLHEAQELALFEG